MTHIGTIFTEENASSVRVSVADSGAIVLDGYGMVAPIVLSYDEGDTLAELLDKALDGSIVRGRE